ncbi:MAG: sugar phosphate nucleotidyltransferase [Candidatus Hodarchaeales archaeon]
MKGLILSGGHFQRMLPLSENIPKTLLKIQGKPLLQYVIDGLISCQINNLVVVIGEGEFFTPVIRYLQTLSKNIKIDLVTQRKPGVRGAILAAEQEFEETDQIFLAHGDIMAPTDFYSHLKHTVARTGADGGVACTLKSSIEDFGVCLLNGSGNVGSVIEHPGQESDVGNYVGAGAYIFPSAFFKALKESKTFDEAINNLITNKNRLAGAIWSYENRWMDIGTPYDLLTANQILFSQYKGTSIHSSATISPSAHLISPVFIGKNVIISHNAVIKGPVFIGDNVYIGTNCLIRDNTVIEEDCVIGFSVELKNSHLQPKTRIGRLSFVGDSIVGKDVEIRTGVTVLNHLSPHEDDFVVRGTNFGRKIGTVIGDNAEIGANVVLKPKTIVKGNETIPPGVVISPET